MGATRMEAIAVPCPQCFAPIGKLCTGRRGERDSLHRERYTHAELQADTAPVEREHRYYDDGPPVAGRTTVDPFERRRVAQKQEEIRESIAAMKHRSTIR